MDKLFVIKIGGNVIDDEIALKAFVRSFAALEGEKILIHGGGKLATRLAEQLNVPQQMVEGRRITDAETLKIVTMVYAGYINKNLVALLQSNDCDAIGLTGADGNAIMAHKRTHAQLDYGFAGDVDAVNEYFLHSLLEQHIAPVIAPITHDGNGQLLNTNADTIAAEVATAMSRLYAVDLILCFEREGVLRDVNDGDSLIPHIGSDEYKDLKAAGIIAAGMVPKMDNALAALCSGVRTVRIGKADKLHDLVNGAAGTTIK